MLLSCLPAGWDKLEMTSDINANDLLSKIVESVTDPFFALDTQWRFTYINAQAEQLMQRPRETLLGKCVWDEFPNAKGSTFEREYNRAVAEQTTVTFETYYPTSDAWFSVRVYPSPEGLAVYFQNIGARKTEEARQQILVRRAAFAAVVGTAINRSGTLAQNLQACAEAMVQYLDAAFARIWTLNESEQMLELQASAGMYTHLDGPHGRVPVGKFKIGLIAQERKPHLTNDVMSDPRVGNQEWAKREGMVAFAGYPLLAGDQVVGVMAMFSREPVTEETLNALALVADTLAQTIQRKRSEEELHASETHFRALADNIPQLAWMADATGAIFWYNQRWFDYTGTTLEEMQGWGWQKVHDPNYVEPVTEKFKECVQAGMEWEDTFPLRGKDDQFRWFLSRAMPIRDADRPDRALAWNEYRCYRPARITAGAASKRGTLSLTHRGDGANRLDNQRQWRVRRATAGMARIYRAGVRCTARAGMAGCQFIPKTEARPREPGRTLSKTVYLWSWNTACGGVMGSIATWPRGLYRLWMLLRTTSVSGSAHTLILPSASRLKPI